MTSKPKPAGYTPGPWRAEHDAHNFWNVFSCADNEFVVGNEGLYRCDGTDEANARLIAAAPELYAEAQVLRCLATSPRFQNMTVAAALAELKANGCGHDDGAAIAKAEGA